MAPQGAVWASFNMVIQTDGHGWQWQGSLSGNGLSLTLTFNDDTIRIYASSMSPSMQPFETVILLQVHGVLYLYY
jgi:hypothetical protein